MKRKKKTTRQRPDPDRLSNHAKVPFIEHLYELRKRLFYVAISVIGWSVAAYAVEQHVINTLLKPAHGQDFIYTSPIGGMNFLFRVCLYVGIAFSIPVIVYQLLRYIEPLMRSSSAKFIQRGSAVSGILAVAGMLFGYFFGLPAALHFLLNQFVTKQVHPLLTIDAYLSFVAVYMLGAALMFQIPLIVLFINRIKPLTPKMLLAKERWVILVSVILALIMNPTPNLVDQIFVAGPIILTYQFSIAIIWWTDRRQKTGQRGKIAQLRAHDEELRKERMQAATELRQSWQIAKSIAVHPETAVATVSELRNDVQRPTTARQNNVQSREQFQSAYVRRSVNGSFVRVRLVQ